MKITINNKTYEIIKNEKDAIDEEVLKEAITEYFENFDFIVGDWAYGKLRLKGFNDKSNKNFKPINDIKNVDNYIKKYCAYGCRYFILKVIEKLYPYEIGKKFKDVMFNAKNKGISFESITRCRRKLQKKYPELKDEKISNLRNQKQKEYIDYSKIN